MIKYVVGIVIGIALTFFIIDYIHVKERLERVDCWLSSTMNDVDRIESEVWKPGYYGTEYTRIDELENRLNKQETE